MFYGIVKSPSAFPVQDRKVVVAAKNIFIPNLGSYIFKDFRLQCLAIIL